MGKKQDEARDLALLAAGAALAPRGERIIERGPREVHHHEHRAPTDESVKLLKEMEEAARNKVDETIRIEGNGFNAVVHLMRAAIDDTLRARMIFDLNGAKMEVEADVAAWKFPNVHEMRKSLLTELRDKAAKEIAGKVLMRAFEDGEAHRAVFGSRLD